ncbi:MAG: Peptidoglycan-binding lysin domain protein [Myxococcales bacterium]|nr:Peptidoglycan-binding lysin domain protein [Myxococcales bacterium]
MRAIAVVVVLLCLVTATSVADAAGKRPAKHHEKAKTKKRVALTTPAKPSTVETKNKRDRSIGAPWSGRLQTPARLNAGERYHLRRPWRTYGTRTTVELVRQAIVDTLDGAPKAHILAVGDLSQESGGWITEHASHQSGRDVDIGLFFKKKPAGYPAAFVRATPSTLDLAATWKLIWNFARTRTEDGGAQFIFLDRSLQTALYRWAEKQGISDKRIASVAAVLRHEPNHDNHIHVRFKCRERDTSCR